MSNQSFVSVYRVYSVRTDMYLDVQHTIQRRGFTICGQYWWEMALHVELDVPFDNEGRFKLPLDCHGGCRGSPSLVTRDI
jgi:hypothetical protein